MVGISILIGAIIVTAPPFHALSSHLSTVERYS